MDISSLLKKLGVLSHRERFSDNGGQMSLGQFQESFQIGSFYSRHHYYDPGSTLTPSSLPEAMLENS